MKTPFLPEPSDSTADVSVEATSKIEHPSHLEWSELKRKAAAVCIALKLQHLTEGTSLDPTFAAILKGTVSADYKSEIQSAGRRIFHLLAAPSEFLEDNKHLLYEGISEEAVLYCLNELQKDQE